MACFGRSRSAKVVRHPLRFSQCRSGRWPSGLQGSTPSGCDRRAPSGACDGPVRGTVPARVPGWVRSFARPRGCCRGGEFRPAATFGLGQASEPVFGGDLRCACRAMSCRRSGRKITRVSVRRRRPGRFSPLDGGLSRARCLGTAVAAAPLGPSGLAVVAEAKENPAAFVCRSPTRLCKASGSCVLQGTVERAISRSRRLVL